ncbi:MAG TPA: beta-galactosidase [Acidimicrobiales bacterium]|nr:beta-galactosidase [Acidimicrobiales bacterium]
MAVRGLAVGPRGSLFKRSALLVGLGTLVVSAGAVAASASGSPSSGLQFGDLVTQAATAAQESAAGVKMAMMELNWADYEPQQGVFSTSYAQSMQTWLQQLQQAGMKVTLGLGLQDTPAWIYQIPGSTYVDQNGDSSSEANFIFNEAVRQQAALYLQRVASDLNLSNFWAIRLTSGGDQEMLYPPGGTYWAFDQAALTGNGLPSTMTPNPFPSWHPGQGGLSTSQIDQWVNWYIGGLADVTTWQMSTLDGLGFSGYFELVTPGSGTRPDELASEEAQDLPDGTTGVGAVWDRYYAHFANNPNVMVYVSSVADGSGSNDTCQPGDDSIAITSSAMGPWSATRWLARIAVQNGLPIGGENPGWGSSPTLDQQYQDTGPGGMMATAIAQAESCNFTVFYWAHDIHLWDGTVPFSAYADMVAAALGTDAAQAPTSSTPPTTSAPVTTAPPTTSAPVTTAPPTKNAARPPTMTTTTVTPTARAASATTTTVAQRSTTTTSGPATKLKRQRKAGSKARGAAHKAARVHARVKTLPTKPRSQSKVLHKAKRKAQKAHRSKPRH